MSNIHEGVSCDICSKSNFGGKRFKCLICYDFDQCETCHEQSMISALALSKPINPTHNHVNTHPMQCILTKNDLELFYGPSTTVTDYGEHISFTCPYCAKNGFSESSLCDHLSSTHLNNPQNESLPTEIVCPICAALPSRCAGDPNHLTEDFLHHLNLEHASTRSLIDIGSDNLASGSVAAAAALRFSRRLNYAQNASSSSRGISIGRNNTFRFQFNNSSSGTSSALSSFMRTAGSGIDSFVSSGSTGASDPIVELLSQLTGVRRANNAHPGTLTLGQLTRERESLHQTGARHHHIFSGSNASKIALSGKLASGTTQPQSGSQSQQNTQLVNQLLELPSCLLQQPLPANARDPRFLLSKYDFCSGDKQENQGQQQPSSNTIVMNGKQANLINDIILSLVRQQLNHVELEVENEKFADDVKQHQVQV
ncbi:E3 ubiquitin- ligase KCMF1 [Brachionus plicatilis]|uniref:RING-type E3 ubiquitin transferase n=1 Tax=Brachionus plicatilis TaxID=10195 RepID=A0A3M7S1L1_BRAPC|nr:E3 ubiquitin- ligase KCMF1 [Brachionus plicatilis]